MKRHRHRPSSHPRTSRAALDCLTPDAAGIDCGSGHDVCSGTFGQGTQIALTATAGAAGAFATWGAPCGNAPHCVRRVPAEGFATATFRHLYRFSVAKAGIGQGDVTCEPSCEGALASSGFVTATANYTGGVAHDTETNTPGVAANTPKSTPVTLCVDNDLCTTDVCNAALQGGAACSFPARASRAGAAHAPAPARCAGSSATPLRRSPRPSARGSRQSQWARCRSSSRAVGPA